MSGKSKNTKVVGNFGETIAVKYLRNNGFEIIERNYTRKWGELDIIARKDDIVHFVEVKSVSYETKDDLTHSVTHETWRPEELVHRFKVHQIEKALQTWISETGYEGDWQIGVIAVRFVPRETFATIRYIDNIAQ